MSQQKRKVFWQTVSVDPHPDGFAISLDGRPIKTPAKALLVAPNRTVADLVAQEWRALKDEVDPEQLPATRFCNAAIDKVAANFDAVVDMLAEYGETDLLCYRATSPQTLIMRQAAAWDPILEWSKNTLGAPLVSAQGVMYVAQPKASVAALKAQLAAFGPFHLAAVHDLITLSGSLLLGLAVTTNHLDAKTAWELSRIDEDWQIEQWGRDEDADKTSARKRQDFLFANQLLQCLNE